MMLFSNILTRVAAGISLAQLTTAFITPDEVGDGANPDASGKVQFYAPKFDTSYPGSWGNVTRNHWTLELNLTRNSTFEVGDDRFRSPVFMLQVKPPAPGLPGSPFLSNGSWALDYNATRSWVVSIGILDFSQMRQVPEGNDKEHGFCPESVYTKECTTAIKNAIKNPVNEYGVYNITGLPSCEGQPTWRGLYPVELDSFFEDGEFFAGDMAFREPSTTGTNTLETYDMRGLLTFPMLLLFRDAHGYMGDRPPLTDEHIVIACVKIDTAHNGAVMPTGGSARAAVAQIWAGVGITLGTGLLLMSLGCIRY